MVTFVMHIGIKDFQTIMDGLHNFRHYLLLLIDHFSYISIIVWCMRGYRKFCQKRSNFDEEREDSNTTITGAIIGPPAKRHLNGFRWRADDDPILNAGLVAL